MAKADILQGTLDLIVLKLLQNQPANGWELTQAIQTASGGVLSVNYGTLYPALHRLEARGWISGSWKVSENGRRARFYSLTTAGRRSLTTEQKDWERFAGALSLILRPQGGGR